MPADCGVINYDETTRVKSHSPKQYFRVSGQHILIIFMCLCCHITNFLHGFVLGSFKRIYYAFLWKDMSLEPMKGNIKYAPGPEYILADKVTLFPKQVDLL